MNLPLREITIEDVYYYKEYEKNISIYYKLGKHGALTRFNPKEEENWLFRQLHVKYYIPECDYH